MGMRCLKLFLYVSFFISLGSFAGDLVYRDGEGVKHPSCQVTSVNSVTDFVPKVCGPRYCTAAHYSSVPGTTTTLSCNGAVVSERKNRLIPCAGRICATEEQAFRATYANDTVNYDFNYDLPGVNVILGSISKKSSANVFLSRSLSKNYIAYSNDGILDKPVIVVEGYDPDNNIFPDAYYWSFRSLISDGRDLIIVNFPDGGASLDDNAALLQSIIAEINGAKSGTYPIAVVGYSMGGMVARKTLKNMELAGINHQVSLYVSFDSPHMGANAPKPPRDTVEALRRELSAKVSGMTDSAIKRAKHWYDSGAARAMLVDGVDFKPAKESDFPSQLVRVGVTSGSLLGTQGMQANSVSEGEYVAGFTFYLYKNWWGSWGLDSQWYSGQINGYYYDNVPGSFAQSYFKAYNELKDGADAFNVWVPAQNKNITFIPTMSSLAIPYSYPQATFKDIVKFASPFDRYIAATTSNDPCGEFVAQSGDGINIKHELAWGSIDYSQLAQVNCALNEFHRPSVVIPDRSLKWK